MTAFGLVVTSPATRLVWTSVELVDAGPWVALVAEETARLRLLENLFRNATEHGPAGPRSQAPEDAEENGGGAVTVTVGATDDGFFVADDDPGIPADDRDQVFDRGTRPATAARGSTSR